MALKDFLEEATIMKEMKHPNLVQLLGKISLNCMKSEIWTGILIGIGMEWSSGVQQQGNKL